MRLLLLAVALLPSPEFRFRHHSIDRDLPGRSYGQTALADLDGDGDLDFVTGRTGGDIYWFEYQGPDAWKRHLLGQSSPSDVGGAVLDVDGDRKPDFVAGGAWYRHGGEPWSRHVFDADLKAVHDLVAADLDGDGDLDVVRSNAWFENADGKGTRWTEHANIPFGNPNNPFPLATRARSWDLDGDRDLDLVMTTNEIRNPKIAWIENADGKGGAWSLHELKPGDPAVRGAYHSLALADFDGDGDPDVFTCEMEGIAGEKPPRWFVWENLGAGRFEERVILDAGLGGHEAVVGDVDGDGDLDICSKLWSPRKDNANGGKMHADYLENLLKSK